MCAHLGSLVRLTDVGMVQSDPDLLFSAEQAAVENGEAFEFTFMFTAELNYWAVLELCSQCLQLVTTQ